MLDAPRLPITELLERKKFVTAYLTSNHSISVEREHSFACYLISSHRISREREIAYTLPDFRSHNFCREKCLLHVTQLTVTEFLSREMFVTCYSTYSHRIDSESGVCYKLPDLQIQNCCKLEVCYMLLDFQSHNCWQEVCYMLLTSNHRCS